MPTAPADRPIEPFRRRLVGAFALVTMEREGAVHGYRLAERIAERTEGAWRPGPGAVYPALQRLVVHGLARSRTLGRRRVYSITPAGRALLRRLRRRDAGAVGGPDPAPLWAEVRGIRDLNEFYLQTLRRDLGRIRARLAIASGPGARSFRARVRRELAESLEALPGPAGRPGRRPP